MAYKQVRPYQVYKCCVMDTSDLDIQFDENGVCMRCNGYKKRILPSWNFGKGKDYDCIQPFQDWLACTRRSSGSCFHCID